MRAACRSRITPALARLRRAAFAGALLLAALGGALAALAASPLTASAEYRHGDDWRHMYAVLEALKADPPQRPLVLLLGGSAARECTHTDRRWRRQIAALGDTPVRAYDLGSASQSFSKKIWMVNELPDVPTLIFIGVNLGRYTAAPPATDAAVEGLPATSTAVLAASLDDYDQHRFHWPHIASDEKKRQLVGDWLRRRYPVFKERFSYNARKLRELVEACQARGFYPVLLNLPLNLRTVGHRLDKPRARYRRNCLAVRDRYGVPWVNYIAKIGLRSPDFADNWHLVEPGRTKWQKRLSIWTAHFIDLYDLGAPHAG